VHNQGMSTINLFKMQYERAQSPQSFRWQFMAMWQVCEQEGLHIRDRTGHAGHSQERRGDKSNNWAISRLKKKGVQEYHMILFLFLSDHQRCRKI